jgi:hypothetical protein
VSCLTNSLYFRVRRTVKNKACSAANIEHIGKGHNVVIGGSARSRRVPPMRPAAVLRPLAMGLTIPCGSRLATGRMGGAEMQRIGETGHQ